MRWVLPLFILAGCTGSASDSAAPAPGAAAPTAAERASSAWNSAEDEVLLGEAYAFCHDGHVDAAQAREWCEALADLDPSRCPGLVETCASPDEPEAATPVPSGCNGNSSATPDETFAAPEPPPTRIETPEWELPECSCQAPDTAMGLLQAVLKVAAALLIALVVGAFLRGVLLAMRRRERARPDLRPVVEASVAPIQAEAVPDTPSEDLLASARRALEQGQLEEAVLYARAASLRALGDAGRVKLHRARTDREYARQVRSDPEVYTPLREVFRAVERVRWAGQPPSADLVRAVFRAAERLVAMGAVAFCLLTLTGIGGPEERYGPSGDAALADLYEDYGFDVHWRMRPLSKLDASTDVLVLGLEHVQVQEGDPEVVRRWVNEGGVLIVVGDAAQLFEEMGALREGTAPFAVSAATDAYLDSPVLPDPVLLFEPGSSRPWVVGNTGILVQAMGWGRGGVVGIAEPRLLHNIALAHPANERLMGFVPYLGGLTNLWQVDLGPSPRLEIAVVNAGQSESPLEAMANAKLLPIVLQCLALFLALALWLGTPFRPLRDPREAGRRSFAEHVRALGAHYAHNRGSRRAAAAYAQYLLAKRGRHALFESARRLGATPDEAEALVRRAEGFASDPDAPADPVVDLALMEELWKIDPTR